ncbi:hypothetical protein BKA81DRAFT_366919 [Phyllosticta paracitricarpa]
MRYIHLSTHAAIRCSRSLLSVCVGHHQPTCCLAKAGTGRTPLAVVWFFAKLHWIWRNLILDVMIIEKAHRVGTQGGRMDGWG